MECYVCREELSDDENKCWLIEDANDPLDAQVNVDPNPVHRQCAVAMIGNRGALGRTVVGYKIGATQPSGDGLILRR